MTTAMTKPKQTMIQVLPPVDFHGRRLELVGYEGEPYVPMKPFVEAMGLNWAAQHRRLMDESGRWSIAIMAIVQTGDGKTREVTCIPLSRLPAWMNTLQVSRIRNPKAIEVIKLFQEESDAVLWQHWKQGKMRPKVNPLPVPAATPIAAPIEITIPRTMAELWLETLKLHTHTAQIVLEQERQIAALKLWREEQEKRDDEIIDAANEKFGEVDQRITAMENERKEAVDLLYTFDKPLLTPEELNTRGRIRAMVQAYARANGGCYKETWQRLYEMFNFDWHTNINGTKTRLGVARTIEAVEIMGKLNELESTAYKLLCDPFTGAITKKNIFATA